MVYSIYKATSTQTGLIYIGYTSTPLWRRMATHKSKAQKDTRCKFYNHIKKYGFEDLTWEIIFQTKDKFHCLEMEIYFISEFNSRFCGLNSHPGGGSFPSLSGCEHPLWGTKRTPQTREKISKNHANVAGEKNPRARIIIAISPQKEKTTIRGGLKNFCTKNNFSYSQAIKILRSMRGPITTRGNLVGWNFVYG